MTEEEKFEAWYAKPLECLKRNPDAGFAILMICFPLIERHIRRKSGDGDRKGHSHRFYQIFVSYFGMSKRDSKSIWSDYRNGLLHQAAFLRHSISLGGSAPIERRNVGAGKKTLMINPVLFADKIVDIIRDEFAEFEKTVKGNYALGEVFPLTDGVNIIMPASRPSTERWWV